MFSAEILNTNAQPLNPKLLSSVNVRHQEQPQLYAGRIALQLMPGVIIQTGSCRAVRGGDKRLQWELICCTLLHLYLMKAVATWAQVAFAPVYG